MPAGLEKTNKKTPCFTVNKKGIISAYAILLLQLCMVCLLLLTQICTTFSSVYKQPSDELLDVAILHSIQKHLQQNKENSEQESPETADISEDEEILKADEDIKWDLSYAGVIIHFYMKENEVSIQYAIKGIQHTCMAILDESKTHIMNYAYIK